MAWVLAPGIGAVDRAPLILFGTKAVAFQRLSASGHILLPDQEVDVAHRSQERIRIVGRGGAALHDDIVDACLCHDLVQLHMLEFQEHIVHQDLVHAPGQLLRQLRRQISLRRLIDQREHGLLIGLAHHALPVQFPIRYGLPSEQYVSKEREHGRLFPRDLFHIVPSPQSCSGLSPSVSTPPARKIWHISSYCSFESPL